MSPSVPVYPGTGWVFYFMRRLISIVMLLVVAWMFTGANSPDVQLVRKNLDITSWTIRIQNPNLNIDCIGYCDFSVDPDEFLVNEMGHRFVGGTWGLDDPDSDHYELTFRFKNVNCPGIQTNTPIKFQVVNPYNPKKIGLKYIPEVGRDTTHMKLSIRRR